MTIWRFGRKGMLGLRDWSLVEGMGDEVLHIGKPMEIGEKMIDGLDLMGS